MRLHNLDYLRGLAATSIMIYHFYFFTFGEPSVNSLLGKLSIYGVSIFYVLSGLTLYLVYFGRFELASFIKKRILRIFPLLWLVTIACVVLSRSVNWQTLFLNLTGLFGFVKPNAYIPVGAWSIGNELVFYAFFPFFVWFLAKNKNLMIALSTTIFLLYLYFAFFVLTDSKQLADQWRVYINPLNQVFLFLSGFLIGYFLKERKVNGIILIVIGCLLFFYPVSGSSIELVTGVRRIVFTAAVVSMCAGFFKMGIKLPFFIHKPLSVLGEISYGVYLIHPLVYDVFFKRLHFGAWVNLIACILITFIICYFVYHYFEKYFMRISGKRSAIPHPSL